MTEKKQWKRPQDVVTNRTYNDLTKLFAQHMRDYRQQLIQAKIMRRT